MRVEIPRFASASAFLMPMVVAAGVMIGLATVPVRAEEPVAEATFTCKDDKTIAATFYADKVDLKLSDGRDLSLPQVISASGARYANEDETFVFWNVGDTAFVTEGADDKETYSDCVAAK